MDGREVDGVVLDTIVAKVMNLENGLRDLGADELQRAGRSLADQVRAADVPSPFLAEVLATSGEAMRRTVGCWPSEAATHAAAAAAAGGVVIPVHEEKDRECASSLAAFWFGTLGSGVHVIALDDWRAREVWKFMTPVVAALGGDVGLITEEPGTADRRACGIRGNDYCVLLRRSCLGPPEGQPARSSGRCGAARSACGDRRERRGAAR